MAIQKTSENYDEKLGGKWDLRKLRVYLSHRYGSEKIDACFTKIEQLIINSFISIQKLMINSKNCFELYGFDIMMDANFKPWLLEVNASPSMTANTSKDEKMKIGLLDDVFTIVDRERVLSGNETSVGGFDLIFKGTEGVVCAPENASKLGAKNMRQFCMKRLAIQRSYSLKGARMLKGNNEEKESGIGGIGKKEAIADDPFDAKEENE